MALPVGTRFQVPVAGSAHKYVALLPKPGGGVTRVPFGARGYQHYKDSVPRALGGGKWSHLDHLDPKRRASYRSRHGAILTKDGQRAVNVRHSPAWFSYHFLW